MLDRTDWKTAPPLWQTGLAGSVALDRPAVLRFATDDFMDRFQAELAARDGDLAPYVATPETWRAPGAGVGAGVPGTLKLYQPTHGRFYLLTAALVCARYGLPDRAVDAGKGESVFYVIRRLEPTGQAAVDPANPATFTEFAWTGEAWVAANGTVAAGEERLPLFAISYHDAGRRRRVLAGMLPVSAREKYENAAAPAPIPPASTDPLAALGDERATLLESAVAAMQGLLQLATTPAVVRGDPETLDMYRESFFFALVDLAVFLEEELEDVWKGTAPPGGATSLPNRLKAVFLDGGAGPDTSWLAALERAHQNRGLVLSDLAHPPAPVTGMSVDDVVDAIGRLGIAATADGFPIEPAETAFFLSAAAALAANPVDDGGDGGDDGEEEDGGASFTEGAVYVAKCVYERPQCLPSHRYQMSRGTRLFRMSHFFDPDAPYRESPIVLPVDTSLEGLRKFPHAAKVAISAQLRKQMDRIQGIKLGDLDDGNIPDEQDGIDLGMICSLSIPIITICALILLMIIVMLLNIVFFWVPLFKICRPKVG